MTKETSTVNNRYLALRLDNIATLKSWSSQCSIPRETACFCCVVLKLSISNCSVCIRSENASIKCIFNLYTYIPKVQLNILPYSKGKKKRITFLKRPPFKISNGIYAEGDRRVEINTSTRSFNHPDTDGPSKSGAPSWHFLVLNEETRRLEVERTLKIYQTNNMWTQTLEDKWQIGVEI